MKLNYVWTYEWWIDKVNSRTNWGWWRVKHSFVNLILVIVMVVYVCASAHMSGHMWRSEVPLEDGFSPSGIDFCHQQVPWPTAPAHQPENDALLSGANSELHKHQKKRQKAQKEKAINESLNINGRYERLVCLSFILSPQRLEPLRDPLFCIAPSLLVSPLQLHTLTMSLCPLSQFPPTLCSSLTWFYFSSALSWTNLWQVYTVSSPFSRPTHSFSLCSSILP